MKMICMMMFANFQNNIIQDKNLPHLFQVEHSEIKIIFITFIIVTFIFLIILFIDKNFFHTYTINYETYSIFNIKIFLKENILTLNKLYNFPVNLITIILIIYLFLTLIAVVKISDTFEGPLRPKFNL